jgi:predicted DNA-binding transcriptional regulator
LLDARNGGELIFERRALLHHALRALGVIPEIRVFRLLIELRQARARLVEVKDASSAARQTA